MDLVGEVQESKELMHCGVLYVLYVLRLGSRE